LFPVVEAQEFAASVQTQVIAALTGYTHELELAAEYTRVLADISGTLIEQQVNEVQAATSRRAQIVRDGANKELAAVEDALRQGSISAKEAATRRAQITQTMTDRITDIERQGQDEVAAARRKLKPFLVAEAIANTALGATKALTLDPTGVLSALTTVLGMAQVATIAAQKFATGTGIVPGVGSGDIVEARLEPGEGVLTKDAMRDIGISNVDAANRGESGDRGSVTNNYYIDTLDPISWEQFLMTRGRDGLIRTTDDIARRGDGAARV
jgi:hypothetical protein